MSTIGCVYRSILWSVTNLFVGGQRQKKKHSAWKELLEIDGLDGDEDEDGDRDGRCGRCGTVSQWYRLIMVTVMASYSVRSRKLERGYIVCREREEARARRREGGCGVESDKVGE